MLASQLEFISKLIEAEKRYQGQYLSRLEPWKELLSRAILEEHFEEFEEFEEKEGLEMPDIAPTKTAFEREMKAARQFTDSYCTNAHRLLRMNNTGYSLLVSWVDRIDSAVCERKAMLESVRNMQSLLEEDVEVLKLLHHEITARLDRQEQELAA